MLNSSYFDTCFVDVRPLLLVLKYVVNLLPFSQRIQNLQTKIQTNLTKTTLIRGLNRFN